MEHQTFSAQFAIWFDFVKLSGCRVDLCSETRYATARQFVLKETFI